MGKTKGPCLIDFIYTLALFSLFSPIIARVACKLKYFLLDYLRTQLTEGFVPYQSYPIDSLLKDLKPLKNIKALTMTTSSHYSQRVINMIASSVEDYIDRIFFSLTTAIDDNQISIQWQVLQHPPTFSSPANFSLSSTKY
ncbi:hypothetical protein M5K25_007372 [Dendrobium thyrsiflorum]|uniref:Uncharacterized protein n=1 Tax=Dendrobium thyrsiflorum TaxID=117978 RepID=A0ABD0VEF6_DENTH